MACVIWNQSSWRKQQNQIVLGACCELKHRFQSISFRIVNKTEWNSLNESQYSLHAFGICGKEHIVLIFLLFYPNAFNISIFGNIDWFAQIDKYVIDTTQIYKPIETNFYFDLRLPIKQPDEKAK